EQAAGAWQDKRNELEQTGKDMSPLEPFTQRYVKMIWAAGQLEVGTDAILAAAKQAGDEPWCRAIRVEAVQVLARGVGGKAGVQVLQEALEDTDARVRALAASGLAAVAPKAASAVVDKVVDDRASLDRLMAAGGDAKAEKTLRAAAGNAHTQGVSLPHLVARADVMGLSGTLSDKSLPEVTRLGALEALARIANDAAQEALVAFAKDDKEDEELRKAAWRGLRRAKRYAAGASREVTS
ncbi:MAG: HEAT repeat domain-containing protein, partial [Myxococcota bacterium]